MMRFWLAHVFFFSLFALDLCNCRSQQFDYLMHLHVCVRSYVSVCVCMHVCLSVSLSVCVCMHILPYLFGGG